MGRTPKTVDDRQEQILDAALKVFAEKGFERATNKNIAEKAGITPGLIYHYFRNKEELLTAAIQKYSALKVVREVTQEMLDQPPDIFLKGLFSRMLEILEDDKFVLLLKVYLPEVIHNAKSAPVLFSVIGEAISHIEKYFKLKIKNMEFIGLNASLTVNIILGSVMDLVLRRKIINDPEVSVFSRAQIADSLTDLVLHGILRK